MSSFSSMVKGSDVRPSPREPSCDSARLMWSQCDSLTYHYPGQSDMTEPEYTHLQQLNQSQVDAQARPPDGPDAMCHPSRPSTPTMNNFTHSTVMSSLRAVQAIDLSTSSEDHCPGMPGEIMTPESHGEVPNFVMAKVTDEKTPSNLSASGSTSGREGSAARVCLEKRFNTPSPDTPRPQDIPPPIGNNLLTVLQQSTAVQDAVLHSEKGTITPNANAPEFSNSQVIALKIIPKRLALHYFPNVVFAKAHDTNNIHMVEEEVGAPAAPRNHCDVFECTMNATLDSAGQTQSGGAKRPRSRLSVSQRKERHNNKERERRKNIRLFCDELNTMVPFCTSGTDKVTTLQWTTSFLQYINKTYGESLKEEFKLFVDENELSVSRSELSFRP